MQAEVKCYWLVYCKYCKTLVDFDVLHVWCEPLEGGLLPYQNSVKVFVRSTQFHNNNMSAASGDTVDEDNTSPSTTTKWFPALI